MAEDGKVVYKIEGDNSQAMKALDEFEKEAKKTGDQFEDTVEDTMEGAEKSVSGAAVKIAKAIGSAFAVKQVIEFGKAAVGVASDLNEVQNVVDTTFGSGASKINEWAKNAAEAFGESELQAKQFTSTLGAMFKSMGVAQAPMEEMSMSLAGLAGDMASFYNLDPTEAFEKLRSGISGETEPLKQLGINMSVVNLEAYAMANGITESYQEMTQAEQATLRYQYIMSATADAQGDFADTSDSFANQQRILKLEIESLAAEIGQDLLPIAMELVGAARDTIEWVRENKDALEALTLSVGGAVLGWKAYKTAINIADAAEATIKGIKGIAAASESADFSAGGLADLLKLALGPTGWAVVAAVAGIAAVTAAVIDLKNAQESLLSDQFAAIDNLPNMADYIYNGLTYNKDGKTEIDFARADQMMAEGTFQKAPKSNIDKSKGTVTKVKDIASEKWKNDFWGTLDETLAYKSAQRHKSGEDFVMSDWTPAYLDYGERVLTASENAKYTAMGGVDGMERSMNSGSADSGFSTSRVEIGFDVSPREMAHAIAPYIIKEFQSMGKWEDVK